MNALSREIRLEIERLGPMMFARFMELALYAPGLGYYEQPGKIGREGDFFTSVSACPLFGQLLAFQFAEWLDRDFSDREFQLVEAGAHDGSLAADILDWFARFRPDLMSRLRYCVIEPSSVRRGWQERTLASWRAKIGWASDINEAAGQGIGGIVFSNEFFDAFPVHRLAWDAGEARWREWRVVFANDKFAWHLDAPAADLTGRLPLIPAELAAVLPDGFIAELSPGSLDWWRTAARGLRRGKLMTVDYGYCSDGWLRPDRPNGSLRAFARHHAGADLLNEPGEQDLTADVNFSAVEEAGRDAGLGPGIVMPQSQFLTEIFARIRSKPEAFGHWDQKSVRQFQTLSHPEHLGRSFQVLVQY
jgi:SAM-dependent MidA family methyltransferase